MMDTGSSSTRQSQQTLLVDESPTEEIPMYSRERPPMYHLVDFDGSGKLVDILKDEGENSLSHYIKSDEFTSNMYMENGKLVGNEVEVPDFSPFATRIDNPLLAPARLRGVTNRPVARVMAYWREDRRGVNLETPLLVCCCLMPTQYNYSHDSGTGESRLLFTRLARCLIETYPQLVNDIYLGREYFGESCIHFALVNKDMGFLKFLIEHGSWINHRARGTFFLPVDQQELHKQDQMCSHETDYCGDKYYGEYPLSFAASLGNKEMYSYLLSKGSDPDAKDSFGNTALHMMVIHQQPDMYVYSMSSVSSVKPKEQSNGYNRTPQILAALTGAPKMFHVIVELKKECHWTYGKMECNSYDLTGIDSINSEQGDTDSQSALILTLNGTGHGHLEMLESTIIARVLEQKWNTFGKKMFATSLLLVLLYLLCLSVCIYTRRSGDLFAIQSGQDIVRLVFEALTVIEAACYTAYDLVRVLVKSGPVTAVKAWVRDAPMKLLFLCSCSLVSLVVIGRLTGCRALEDVCLSLVAVGSWSYLLFYCRGFRLVGPFVVMIYEMILVDVLRFVLIYVIFLIGFSQVFHFLLKDRAESFETAWGSAMTLFQMTLGSFKYSELKKGKHVILVHILFMVFMILAGVLLFNMLIAMMAGTYQNITHRSYMEWRRQWAKIIMVLESSLSSSQRLKYQNMYSIDMNSILQPSGRRARRIPALMVTKQRDETCIKYQSAAFNWKRAEALTKGLKVLRVLGKCESEILTRQAVASSQRKQTGALKTWTAPNGNTHD